MIKQHLDADRGLLVRTVGPTLTSSDLHHAVLSWRQDADFDALIPVLWDLRGTRFESTITQVLRTRQRMRQLPTRSRRHGRTAFLVNQDETRELLRRLAELAEWDTRWQVFETEVDAVAWLLQASEASEASA